MNKDNYAADARVPTPSVFSGSLQDAERILVSVATTRTRLHHLADGLIGPRPQTVSGNGSKLSEPTGMLPTLAASLGSTLALLDDVDGLMAELEKLVG